LTGIAHGPSDQIQLLKNGTSRMGVEISVRVKYKGLLPPILGTQADEIKVREGARVNDLLNLLVEKHGEVFAKNIYSYRSLRPTVKIMVNGCEVEPESLSTESVPADSVVYIVLMINPMAGG